MSMSRLPGLSLAINTGRPPYPILGDPGAASRAWRKGERKVFKPRWKSPWVRTLTGSFPNSQANAGSWLATKMLCIIVPNPGIVSPEFFSWHDGHFLATAARFVHQAFLTRNEDATDESENWVLSAGAIQFALRKFCFWRITMYHK